MNDLINTESGFFPGTRTPKSVKYSPRFVTLCSKELFFKLHSINMFQLPPGVGWAYTDSTTQGQDVQYGSQ